MACIGLAIRRGLLAGADGLLAECSVPGQLLENPVEEGIGILVC